MSTQPSGSRSSSSVRLMLGIDPQIDIEFLAALIDSVAHPIFVKDRSFRFVLLNRALCELVGYARAEMLGRTDYDLFPREQCDFFRQKDLEMFRSGATVSIEEELVTDSHGVTHIMATKKVPLRDPDGEVMHLVGIMHEVTELRAAQEGLRKANEDLERRVAERSAQLKAVQEELLRQERLATLGKLAGGLAHQIRNPLSVISNATNILRRAVGPVGDGEKPSDAATALAIIREEVWRANRIITDLLDYARVRPAVKVPSRVVDLVDAALEGRELPARIRVVKDLPEVPLVAVDAAQVHGALDNLVRNAFEAMPRGGTLTFRAAAADRSVILSVLDTGEGIPAEIRPRLFEPLLTTKPDGLGLGLTTARNLVENQGGTIRFETGPEGTRFDLVLPVAG